MNKKVKKILVLVSILALFVIFDIIQVKLFDSDPIFYIKKDVPYGKVHVSFLTDVYYCDNEGVYVESKDSDFACPVQSNNREFTIIYEDTECEEKLDFVYEDTYNKYYLKCEKSDKVFIMLDTGVKFPIKEALERQLVTVSELEREGLDFYKEIK